MQGNFPDDVVNLVQNVEIGGSTEIEFHAVVFVFPERGQMLGQEEPCAAWAFRPKLLSEPVPNSSPDIRPQKIPGLAPI